MGEKLAKPWPLRIIRYLVLQYLHRVPRAYGLGDQIRASYPPATHLGT